MNKIIGVTGIMGSGKTTICEQILKENKNIIYINIDHFRLDLRNNNKDFQQELFTNIKGLTNLEEINKYIYTNKENMLFYKKTLYKYFNKYLKESKGDNIIIVDWALIIDDNLLDYFNKIILVTCSKEKIYKRLDGSYWPLSEIKHRLSLQLTTKEKIKQLESANKEYLLINTEEKIDYSKIIKFIEE